MLAEERKRNVGRRASLLCLRPFREASSHGNDLNGLESEILTKIELWRGSPW